MGIELRALLTIVILAAFALSAFLLRPSQRFPAALQRFNLEAKVPLYRLLYTPTGHARRFAWLLPVFMACIAVAGIWLVFP